MTLGPQFQYPKTPEDIGYRPFERAHQLHGTGQAGFDRMFPGERGQATSLWPVIGRPKRGTPYDRELVAESLSSAPELDEMDARFLHGTQPSVTRAGLSYYMSDEYERTGETYADPHVASNRFPVVYQREDGRNLLLSGHHRATAALLKGRPLRARIIEGP